MYNEETLTQEMSILDCFNLIVASSPTTIHVGFPVMLPKKRPRSKSADSINAYADINQAELVHDPF